MSLRSLVEKLTSEEARKVVRSAARLVLEIVGDGDGGHATDAGTAHGSNGSAVGEAVSDAAKVASAVAATAGVVERLASAARRRSRVRSGGKLAVGVALGAAAVAGLLWMASPEGRRQIRALWHRARGWRRPRSNGAPRPDDTAGTA